MILFLCGKVNVDTLKAEISALESQLSSKKVSGSLLTTVCYVLVDTFSTKQ